MPPQDILYKIIYSIDIVYKESKMGRKKLWDETLLARLASGTISRIDAVLGEGETRTAFLRAAIEHEVQTRVVHRDQKNNPQGCE